MVPHSYSSNTAVAYLECDTGALHPAHAPPACLVLQLTPLLRERCFGFQLELTCHQNYCPAWEGDAADPASKPCGCMDGESVQDVSVRVQQLFQVRAALELCGNRCNRCNRR
jgi:broad specificity phosphatase PhoE